MLKRPAVPVATLVALVVAGVGLTGQQPVPVFRSGTRLVEVTVTVADKKGDAAIGLTPADFVVLDQGKPRPVEVFHFDGGRTRSSSAAPVAPVAGTFSNLPSATDGGPRNVTALVLDTVNTPPRQGPTARGLMMRYLRTLAPKTTTALFVLSDRLYVLHDFTDDPALLRTKLEKAKLPHSTGWEIDDTQTILEAERFLRFLNEDADAARMISLDLRADAMANAAIRFDRLQRSLAQLEALGAHLAGIPGRKSVVWIGGGLSMAAVTSTANGARPTPELLETREEDVRRTSRRLAQQGVVLYIVDANRTETPPDTRAQMPQATPLRGRGNFESFADTAVMSSDTKAPMLAMASVTGGRYFYPEDTSGVAKVVDDMEGSYTLGFYLPDAPDDKWHKLKVQVKRPGLTVRHREGYLAASNAEPPAAWTDAMWQAALSNPIPSAAIPLNVTCKATPAGEIALTVLTDALVLQFVPDGENLRAKLEVMISDRTAAGPGRATRAAITVTRPAADAAAMAEQPSRYNVTWKPAMDAVGLRVIVRDVNTGRYGSLDVPLAKVPRAPSSSTALPR